MRRSQPLPSDQGLRLHAGVRPCPPLHELEEGMQNVLPHAGIIMIEFRGPIAKQSILNYQVPVCSGRSIVCISDLAFFMLRYKSVQKTIQKEKFLLERDFKDLLENLPLNVIGKVSGVLLAFPGCRCLGKVGKINGLEGLSKYLR